MRKRKKKKKKRKVSPPCEGEKEENGLHTFGGQYIEVGESIPSRRAYRSRRQQPGVGTQGQAPGQIMSTKKPGHIHISSLTFA